MDIMEERFLAKGICKYVPHTPTSWTDRKSQKLEDAEDLRVVRSSSNTTQSSAEEQLHCMTEREEYLHHSHETRANVRMMSSWPIQDWEDSDDEYEPWSPSEEEPWSDDEESEQDKPWDDQEKDELWDHREKVTGEITNPKGLMQVPVDNLSLTQKIRDINSKWWLESDEKKRQIEAVKKQHLEMKKPKEAKVLPHTSNGLYINGRYNGSFYLETLFDTGCTYNIIHELSIPEALLTRLPSPITTYGMRGQESTSKHECTLQVEMGSCIYDIHFIVSSDISEYAILGQEFMTQFPRYTIKNFDSRLDIIHPSGFVNNIPFLAKIPKEYGEMRIQEPEIPSIETLVTEVLSDLESDDMKEAEVLLEPELDNTNKTGGFPEPSNEDTNSMVTNHSPAVQQLEERHSESPSLRIPTEEGKPHNVSDAGLQDDASYAGKLLVQTDEPSPGSGAIYSHALRAWTSTKEGCHSTEGKIQTGTKRPKALLHTGIKEQSYYSLQDVRYKKIRISDTMD